MVLTGKCCVKGTSMLMSSPRMVILQVVLESQSDSRNETEIFQLNTRDVGPMQGGQTKQGELIIPLTHEDHKPIIFYRVLKAGNSVLLAAKMVIKNPDKVNSVIVNGKQSKEYFHKVT